MFENSDAIPLVSFVPNSAIRVVENDEARAGRPGSSDRRYQCYLNLRSIRVRLEATGKMVV